jgi:hypothetical protein
MERVTGKHITLRLLARSCRGGQDGERRRESDESIGHRNSSARQPCTNRSSSP